MFHFCMCFIFTNVLCLHIRFYRQVSLCHTEATETPVVVPGKATAFDAEKLHPICPKPETHLTDTALIIIFPRTVNFGIIISI